MIQNDRRTKVSCPLFSKVIYLSIMQILFLETCELIPLHRSSDFLERIRMPFV